MATFEQFYNQTLPTIINVINAQGNELILQRYLIYSLFGIWVIYIVYKIFSKFVKVERRGK